MLKQLGLLTGVILAGAAAPADQDERSLAEARVLCSCTDGPTTQAIAARIELHKADPRVAEMPGFYSAGSKAIPTGVTIAARSVFKVFRPLNFRTVPTSQVIARIDELSGKTAALKVILPLYAKSCSYKQLSSCSVPTAGEEGTGFLIGNKRTLYTAAHVFEGDGYSAKFDVFVLDLNRKIIFNPLSAPEPAKVITPELMKLTTVSLDYAVMQFPTDLGSPLRIGASSRTGSPLYAIGFPSETGDAAASRYPRGAMEVAARNRAPFPNSDGVSQYVTIGSALEWKTDRERNFTQRLRGFFPNGLGDVARIAYSNNDGIEGMSGGPLVSADGAVVGIMALVGFDRPPNLNFAFAVRPVDWPPVKR